MQRMLWLGKDRGWGERDSKGGVLAEMLKSVILIEQIIFFFFYWIIFCHQTRVFFSSFPSVQMQCNSFTFLNHEGDKVCVLSGQSSSTSRSLFSISLGMDRLERFELEQSDKLYEVDYWVTRLKWGENRRLLVLFTARDGYIWETECSEDKEKRGRGKKLRGTLSGSVLWRFTKSRSKFEENKGEGHQQKSQESEQSRSPLGP